MDLFSTTEEVLIRCAVVSETDNLKPTEDAVLQRGTTFSFNCGRSFSSMLEHVQKKLTLPEGCSFSFLKDGAFFSFEEKHLQSKPSEPITVYVKATRCSGPGSIMASKLSNALSVALAPMLQDMRGLSSDLSWTRAASKITVNDFKVLRSALKVVVTFEDAEGNIVDSDALNGLIEDDKFWDERYERQQKLRYIEELKSWVPSGGYTWKDADGHTINLKIDGCPFPVSGQNDQVAHLHGVSMEQGAVLAVELKRKKLTMRWLRQAEVKFYLWSNVSLLPFVHLITDMQTGGVAIYCRSKEENRIHLVQVILKDMEAVKQFMNRILNNLPPNSAVKYGDDMIEGIDPPRKKFRPGDSPFLGGVVGGPSYRQQESHLPSDNKFKVSSQVRLLLWTLGTQLLQNGDVGNLSDFEGFEELFDSEGFEEPV